MESPNIKTLIDFAEDIIKVHEENRRLKQANEMLTMQLIIFCMNNGGYVRGLDCPDLSDIDFPAVKLGIGYDTCSVSAKGRFIKSWDELPKKKKEADELTPDIMKS